MEQLDYLAQTEDEYNRQLLQQEEYHVYLFTRDLGEYVKAAGLKDVNESLKQYGLKVVKLSEG